MGLLVIWILVIWIVCILCRRFSGGGYVYFEENYGGDFLGGELFFFVEVVNFNFGLIVVIDDFEGLGFDVFFDGGVIEMMVDKVFVWGICG